MKRFMALFLAIVMVMSVTTMLFATPAAAADTDPNGVYVTPAGAGSKDGTSWENAIEGDVKGALQAAWVKTPSNGTLYIGGGNYLTEQSISITSENCGKSLEAQKKIVGVNVGNVKPTFFGPFSLQNQKGTFIKFAKDSSFVTIDNIAVKQYGYPIYLDGNSQGLRFYNIDCFDMLDGMYFKGGATADAPLNKNRDFIVDNCTFTRFCKTAIRFRDGNDGMVVTNCTADAGGEANWIKGNFPLGFHAANTVAGAWDENITYVNCLSMNAYQEPDDRSTYWNGDGFCSERNTRNITYIRCRSYNNTDGGWDDKCGNAVLIDCISSNNKRNFRFWSAPTFINCLCVETHHPAEGMGGGCGVWAGRFASPKFYNSTVYNASIQIDLGGIEFYDSILYRSKTGDMFDKKNESIILQNTLLYEGNGEDPEFVNAKAYDPANNRFDGKNADFNSKFGASKGYYYDAATYDTKFIPTQNITKDTFADVSDIYSWAKESIEFMTSNDYMPGISPNAFAPYSNMTRLQFAVMLVRTLGIKAEATGSFADMDRYKKWDDRVYNVYYDDVAIAKAAGIVKGYPTTLADGTQTEFFNPGGTITREEMMVMLSRAMKLSGKLPNDYNGSLSVLDSFNDISSISEWAKQDVANMVEKAVIIGSDGMINPQGKATRAEGAVIGKRVA